MKKIQFLNDKCGLKSRLLIEQNLSLKLNLLQKTKIKLFNKIIKLMTKNL